MIRTTRATLRRAAASVLSTSFFVFPQLGCSDASNERTGGDLASASDRPETGTSGGTISGSGDGSPSSSESDASPVDQAPGVADASVPPPIAIDAGTNDTGTGTVPPPLEVDAGWLTSCPSGAPPVPPQRPPPTIQFATFPMIRHWEQPAQRTEIALTFDDGPDDAGVTDRVLDVLKAEGIRATFFINTRGLRASQVQQHALYRMYAEGHVVGNHTVDHPDLASPNTNIEAELIGVEQDVHAVFPCAPALSLVRAPYGSPYLSGSDEARDRVYPVVARHGVHVGWSIESLDWECQGKGSKCFLPRILDRLDAGKRGAILLHSTVPDTADALPAIIAEIRARGLVFVTAEALVSEKYGASSADVTRAYAASH